MGVMISFFGEILKRVLINILTFTAFLVIGIIALKLIFGISVF